MCACPRDKVIETYIGVRTLQERGVLMCSCVGVWGRERLLYVCVCVVGGLTSDRVRCLYLRDFSVIEILCTHG